MRMRLYVLCLILTIAIGKLKAQTNYGQFIKIVFDDYISGSLFGKIWKFDEYCGDSRDSSAIIKDDLEAELFFNGTKLASLSKINSNTKESLNQVLDDLNYHGIKAKKSASPVCSINSWGYSDKRQFELSNLPYDNETECKLMIDSLYNSLNVFKNSNIYKSSSSSSSSSNVDIIKNQPNNDHHLLKQSPEVVSSNLSLHWEQLNTFGRAPSGSLSWAHIWTGDYDTCINLPSTRYCFGAFRSENWPQYNTEIAYKVGVCLPRSCNSNLIKISEEYFSKTDQLIRFNLIENFGLTTNKNPYKLVDLYCPPANDSLFRSPLYDNISTVLVIIALIWISLTIYATIEPSMNNNPTSFLAYFDLKLSWKKFIKVNNNKDRNSSPPPSSSQLEGVNFLKNITMVWLVISHFYMLNLASLSNWQNLRNQVNSLIGCFLLQGQHGVPLFFIISGLLVGYKNLNNKKLNSKKLIFNRYIRLLPMYLLIYAYIKKFGHLISSGPIWDYGVSNESEARQCMMESWFVPILMLANFIPPPAHCILTGWHIANDFQIYLLLPFLIHIYQKSRFKGTLIVLFSFIATHLYHVWNFYSTTRYAYRQFALEPFIFGPLVVLGRLAYDYVNPFGRLGTYFLGVALADLLLNNNNNIKRREGINYEMKRGSDKLLSTTTKTTNTTTTTQNNNNDNKQKQIGDSLCLIPEKNVVEQQQQRQESECLNDELLVNLSTDHNNNNHQHLQKQPANVQQQQQQVMSSSPPSSLAEEKNEIPVCCQAPSNSDQQARFKDIVLFLSGLALITFSISIPVTSDDMKYILGSSGKYLSYPILRCFCEIGWALIVYAVLAKQSNSMTTTSLKVVDKKLEEKSKSIKTSFSKQTTKTTTTKETRVSNVAPGLALACGFMRLSIWDILVKMHYTFILVHFTVVKYILQSKRHVNSFTWIEFNQSLLFTIVMAYLVSMVVYLTVEAPLNLMINRLMGIIENGRQRDTSKKSTC